MNDFQHIIIISYNINIKSYLYSYVYDDNAFFYMVPRSMVMPYTSATSHFPS